MLAANKSILLIDDSEADCEAAVRALKRTPAQPAVRCCSDGDEALTYLRTEYAALEPTNRPAVILLDLNLPGTDGRHVLEQIKADEKLKHIPVVILTTSADRSDVSFCYRNGASGYLTKPVNLLQFSQALRDFCAYWFDTVVLPESGRTPAAG